MIDQRSELDEIRDRMSARRRNLRVVDPATDEFDDEFDAGSDANDAAAVDAAEAALADAQAWAKARQEAFVVTESVTQLSLMEFLR